MHTSNGEIGLPKSWQDTLMNRMGMRIISQSPERTVIEMPISGNTQPQGILHGGASAALAETSASAQQFIQSVLRMKITSSSPSPAYPTGFSTSKKGASNTRALSSIESS